MALGEGSCAALAMGGRVGRELTPRSPWVAKREGTHTATAARCTQPSAFAGFCTLLSATFEPAFNRRAKSLAAFFTAAGDGFMINQQI